MRVSEFDPEQPEGSFTYWILWTRDSIELGWVKRDSFKARTSEEMSRELDTLKSIYTNARDFRVFEHTSSFRNVASFR